MRDNPPENCASAALPACRQQQFLRNRNMPLAVKDHDSRFGEPMFTPHSWGPLKFKPHRGCAGGCSQQEPVASIPVSKEAFP